MISGSPEVPSLPAEPHPAAAGIGNTPADTTLSEALLTIRKRKYLIGVIALLGVLYGFYKGTTQPRLYEAAGTIEIRSGASNQFRVSGSNSSYGSSNSSFPSQIAIIKSDTVLLTVARDLDLPNSAAFTGYTGPNRHLSLDDPFIRQSTLAAMNNEITVSAVPKTDLVRISCSTLDPKLSADIVNRLIREFIQRSLQSSFEATQRVSDFLSLQLRDLKQQVETQQEQLIDLQKRIGVQGFDPQHNEIQATLDDLTRAVGQAQISRIQQQSRYHTLSGMNPDALDSSIGAQTSGGLASPLPNLRAQRDQLRAQLAQLNATLLPNHPQVKSLQAQLDELSKQINQEQGRLLDQAKQAYVAARDNESQTRAALEAEQAVAYKLRDALVEYTLRQRDFESNRTLYEGLSQRLRTAGIEAGLESTEIDIIDNAVPPIAPSLQSRTSMMVVNGLVMLVFGIVLAFILENLDTGIRTVAQIESISGLPSLALIPRVRRTPADMAAQTPVQRNLGVIGTPMSQFSEAFRALRTSLLLAVPGREPKVMLLTSATPGEGKTTVAMNLACVLSQRDVRVLLIDADLRRPTVHHRFSINGKVGLSSVLTGSATLEEAVQRVPEVPLLDILVSGPVPPFPTEMLGSQVMHQLLERCRGIYTHIVLDSPPLLSITDSVVLSREADAVVLVVRQGKSNKHAVRRARDLLLRSGTRVTGTALNAVDLNSPEYYSYYGYSGYSGYASAGVDSKGWESKSGKGRKPRKGDES
ncbi:MAG TPA: polysaccharide biosynthesis tyrosine autokinase [Acidobacteriaceae bacterium]|jgi:capsular exopolysaccharide synthesis family protein|nr:polysaccharide biosynthesis tyrosine autokinase [Acidobacteriaceae bacterium]